MAACASFKVLLPVSLLTGSGVAGGSLIPRRCRAWGTQPPAEDARPAGGRTGRSSERGQVELKAHG